MARVGFAAFVASLSGKVANAVFSRWKGRYYVRTRVIPANPNTAAQQGVRNTITRLNSLWQSITAALKTPWTKAAGPTVVSAWNWFVHLNFDAELAGTALTVCPYDEDLVGISTLAGATGAAQYEIDLTWTDDGAGVSDEMIILAREDGTDVLIDVTPAGPPPPSAEACTCTMPKAATTYDMYALTNNALHTLFTLSSADQAVVSHA